MAYFKDHRLRAAEERGAKINLEVEVFFRPFRIGEDQEVFRLTLRGRGPGVPD